MSLTRGTVPPMRALDPDLVEQMGRELAKLTAAYARTESKIDREKRNAAIAKWRRTLGEGSLSEIARRAKVSRVQAGRIWAAAKESEATGQPPRPTRHYYQSVYRDPAEPVAAEIHG